MMTSFVWRAVSFSIAVASFGLVACGADTPPAKAPEPAPPVASAAPPVNRLPPQPPDSPTASAVRISPEITTACGINDPDAYFAFDSAHVRPDDAHVLAQLVTCFSTGPLKGRTMKLVGHADPRGGSDYNMTLGQSRADSVASYLTGKGMEKGKTESTTRGAMDATGYDDPGWGARSARRHRARTMTVVQQSLGGGAIGVDTPAGAEAPTMRLDLLGLFEHAAWPVKITIGLLVGCSLLVWVIAILKLLQIGRLRSSEQDFERRTLRVGTAMELFEIAGGSHGAAPGARIVGDVYTRGAGAPIERLRAVADRAILAEGQRARALMWLLAFIAAGAPFIGLFGTVYGIMDAFIRIGAAKTASLPVVAPAIGEALITTAIGLAAAIPAVFFYNWIDKRVGDFVAELEVAAAEWVALVAEQTTRNEPVIPYAAGGRFPSAGARQRP